MSETAGEIAAEAKQFLDDAATGVERSLRRSTVVDPGIEIEQMKFIRPDEMALVRAKGALAVGTTEWFNDVEWLQHPRKDERSWRDLSLDAEYPLDYFVEKPTAGLFTEIDGKDYWADQYGAISGFGNGDTTNLYLLRFVTPGSRTITELRYPDDPTALDQYNARYQQYLQTLDETDPRLTYYRGWSHAFSHHRGNAPLVLGGLSLAGIGVSEVLRQGSAAEEDYNCTRILLHHEPKQGDYVGRNVFIVGDEAITEPYWDGEDDREPASEELLETTLELVKRATS